MLRRILSNSRVVAAPRAVIPTRGVQDFLSEGFKQKENPQPPVVGRAWKASELRGKSWDDLHKLWWVLVRERNKIETEKLFAKQQGGRIHNPERLKKVRLSLARVKTILHEREMKGLLGEEGVVPFVRDAIDAAEAGETTIPASAFASLNINGNNNGNNDNSTQQQQPAPATA